MAAYVSVPLTSRKAIVRGLPDTWAEDHVMHYLEMVSGGRICISLIQTFLDVRHTALLTLDQSVSEETIVETQRGLHRQLFDDKHRLELELTPEVTGSVLVHLPQCEVTPEHVFFFFDTFQFPGCQEGGVICCLMYLDFGFAVVDFTSSEAAEAVIAQGAHEIQKGKLVTVESWYYPFHSDLLQKYLLPESSASARPLVGVLAGSDDQEDRSLGRQLADSRDAEKGEDLGGDAARKCPQTMAIENEQLTKQIHQLKNRKEVRFPVPGYQWALLKDRLDPLVARDLQYLGKEEVVVFSGTEEEWQDVRLQLLMLEQNLNEEEVRISAPVVKLLMADKGKRWLDEVTLRHPRCLVKIGPSSVLCAAHAEHSADLEQLRQEVHNAFSSRTVPVEISSNLTSSPQFHDFKLRLEEAFSVVVVLPMGEGQDIQLHGFSRDMKEAERQLVQYISANQRHRLRFHIAGRLQGEACRMWSSPQLDKVKAFIYKNEGMVVVESTKDGYLLEYQCREDVLPELTGMLQVIVRGIVSETIDLNTEFPNHSGALVINGLRDMGKEIFCFHLQHLCNQEGVKCVLDLTVPDQRPVPPFRGRAAYGNVPCLHGASVSDLPHSVTAGNGTVTLNMGDITTEQMLSERTGIQSLSFEQTHWPVMTRISPQTTLPMSVIVHAILAPVSRPGDVTQVVKHLVLKCLRMSEGNGVSSIAFPPLGVGRRFKFDGQTTATAMMAACREFLMTDQPIYLRTIRIVVYNDPTLADQFLNAMTRTFPASRDGKVGRRMLQAMARTGWTVSKGTSVLSQKIQANMRAAGSDRTGGEPGDSGQRTGPQFEAFVCVTQTRDLQKVREFLVRELKATFLWSDRVRHHIKEEFLALPRDQLQLIAQDAVRNNVLMVMSGEDVELKGHKAKVQEVLLKINRRLHHLDRVPAAQGQSRREQQGLPVDTDRIPGYWRVCQRNPQVTYDSAIVSWERCGVRLNSVSPETRAVVEKLIQSTWEKRRVRSGADAKNLTHSYIKVIGVERLENPVLWKRYSQCREYMMDMLAYRRAATCQPLETIPDSKGPIKTTQAIHGMGPLSQDIYPQVNEHYLFHGTKRDVLTQIYAEGLDDRMGGEAMLGRGVYCAESATKADQYADPINARAPPSTPLKMMLIRVLLGEPYLYTDANPCPFKRPPCLTCKGRPDQCACHGSRLYDSVVYDSSKLFREFVVYDRRVCYPEYIITYVRK